MTQLSIEFKNAELVRKGLQDLAAEVPRIGKQGIWSMMQTTKRRMREYWDINVPPELPSYQRTGTLANGYVISATPNGYRLSNTTPYTKYVVGNAYGLEQAWMHAKPGRHTLMRDVMEEEVAKQPPEIEKEISMVARRSGL